MSIASRSGRGGRTGRGVGSALVAMLIAVTVALSAPAGAAPASELKDAVMAARSGTSCAALQHNSNVEQAADIVNHSTYIYLRHSAENTPAHEMRPTHILKDVGIDAEQVISLQGAGRRMTDAIKGLLLQGYEAIPDCSYTEFGVSHYYEPDSGLNLVVAILVGAE